VEFDNIDFVRLGLGMKPKYIVPIDPALRDQVMKIVEKYKVPNPNLHGIRAELIPTAMKNAADMLAAYDRGELNVTLQKELIGMMKLMVRKYPV
jgi:hypothetical protein